MMPSLDGSRGDADAAGVTSHKVVRALTTELDTRVIVEPPIMISYLRDQSLLTPAGHPADVGRACATEDVVAVLRDLMLWVKPAFDPAGILYSGRWI